MQLLESGGLDVRVLGQKVVEKGGSALRCPDDDEVAQRAQLAFRPSLRGVKLVFQPEYLQLLFFGPLYLLDLLGSLCPALRRAKLFRYLRELLPLAFELLPLFESASPGVLQALGSVLVLLTVRPRRTVCDAAPRVQECLYVSRYIKSFIESEDRQERPFSYYLSVRYSACIRLRTLRRIVKQREEPGRRY